MNRYTKKILPNVFALALLLMAVSCSMNKKLAENKKSERKEVSSAKTLSVASFIDSLTESVSMFADSIVFAARYDSSGNMMVESVSFFRPSIERSTRNVTSGSEVVKETEGKTAESGEVYSLMNDKNTEVENFFDVSKMILILASAAMIVAVVCFALWLRYKR